MGRCGWQQAKEATQSMVGTTLSFSCVTVVVCRQQHESCLCICMKRAKLCCEFVPVSTLALLTHSVKCCVTFHQDADGN